MRAVELEGVSSLIKCADVEVGAKAEARAEEVKALRGLTLKSCLSGKPLDELAFYM